MCKPSPSGIFRRLSSDLSGEEPEATKCGKQPLLHPCRGSSPSKKPQKAVTPEHIEYPAVACRVIRWRLWVLAICVASLAGFFLYRRFRRMFYEKNEVLQSLSLFSEAAFYYSFYGDVVKASSFTEGVKLLLKDTRSEYPDVLNALRRFNIYQELFVGAVWRAIPSPLMFFSSPWNCYSAIVITLVASGIASLAATAAYLGGAVSCGIATVGFFAGNFVQRLILRMSSIPLRENWGTPFLWMQIGCLVVLLRHAPTQEENSFRRTRGWLLAFGVTTFLLILTWQFSVFILTTQGACLFAVVLCGYPVHRTVVRIFLIYCAVFVLALAVTFCPRYLVMSFFPQMVVAILPVLLLFPPVSWLSPRRSDERPAISSFAYMMICNCWRGILSVIICALLRVLIMPMLGPADDSHVVQMLLTKFGLAEHTFDSKIYLMGGTEFGFLPYFMLELMYPSKVLFIAGFMAIVCSCCCLGDIWWHKVLAAGLTSEGVMEVPGDSKSDAVATASASSLDRAANAPSSKYYPTIRCHAEVLFVVLQTGAFCVLMCLIARLRVLALPMLCLLAGTASSPYLWTVAYGFVKSVVSHLQRDDVTCCSLVEVSRNRLHRGKSSWGRFSSLWCLAVAVLPFALKLPWSEMQIHPMPENSAGKAKVHVIEWMNENLPPGAGVLSDMPFSSAVRVATNLSTVINPQYEDVKMRQRVQYLYGTSACPPIDVFADTLRANFSTDYLLMSVYRCAAPSDRSAVNVWDVADMVDDRSFKCSSDVSVYQRFCWRIQLEETYFEMLYRNSEFAVLRRKNITEPVALVPYHKFNGKAAINNVATWEPWIKRCLKTDPHCALNIAGFARQLLDLYKFPQASKALYQRLLRLYPDDKHVMYHYAEYLDFDLKKPKEAEPFYEDALTAKDVPSRYLADYALFVDQEKDKDKYYREAIDTLMRTLSFLEKSDTEIDVDVYNLCRAAGQLLQFSEQGYGTPEERQMWKTSSMLLWERVKKVNVQHDCVTEEWNSFHKHNKTDMEILKHFMFWR
eukprot:GHVQ01028203.1.p1 GENE.GHVQ01028203.1~~GHVQ01028203.1.p1  ORF type:complete len:1023 (-),score=97.22 GHVQ01028203.1:163-3231(-)